MRELIMDHGAEFGAHRVHDDGKWDSDFKQHLGRYGIKPILARVKHPQTNGKLERWFGKYQSIVRHSSPLGLLLNGITTGRMEAWILSGWKRRKKHSGERCV